jgi:hypothetical protein
MTCGVANCWILFICFRTFEHILRRKADDEKRERYPLDAATPGD